MGDRWGPDGPPSEAYSRVSRDLAAVTVGFTAYLDGLPDRLVAAYDCAVRPVTSAELIRLRQRGSRRDSEGTVYAVEPRGPDRATLLVDRTTFERGEFATVGIGQVITELIPNCFCDACDEDSDSLIAQTDTLVEVTVGGFREFRRTYRPRRAGRDPAASPSALLPDARPGLAPTDVSRPTGRLVDDTAGWLEEGYEWRGGMSAGASGDVRGALFDRQWNPWAKRAGATAVL